MIPRTLSASSLQVAELCMDRWNAEYMLRGPSVSNAAADVGTTVHGGFERWVDALFISKTHEDLRYDRVKAKELLLTFMQMSYVETFGTADYETSEYRDALDLTMKWFKRTSFEGFEVISVEDKKTIPVPYNHPDGTTHTCDKCSDANTPGVCYVPFNYIMDRVDYLGDNVWRVVDYKSVRMPITPDDLETKLQARAYALAMQIEHPDAAKIVVCFDLLRHQQVSITFTRDDNIAFWRYLTETTQRIVDMDPADIKPKINAECGYCVKKHVCPLLKKNIRVGGIESLSVDEKAALHQMLSLQMKANNRQLEELEEALLLHAYKTESLEWETDDGATIVEVGITGGRRSFDAQQAASIMGPDLFAQMGNMTLGNLEKIIKDESLDQGMRDSLAALINPGTGNPKIFVKDKKKII